MRSCVEPYCVRLRMLSQLAAVKDELQIGIPDFCVISHSEIVRMAAGQPNAESQVVENLTAATAGLQSDRLFARAQPLDESTFPGHSFAGIYKSYVPRRATPRIKNLTDGLATVLAGRYNRHANYYYSRHGMESARPVDVMFSSIVENTVGFGTAYVNGDKCLLTYFDSPVSIFLEDPVRLAARRGSAIGPGTPLCNLMFRISELWDLPIDIEFLIDGRCQVFISQVRPMPGIHSRNWRMVREECWDEICQGVTPSNVVNTVGTMKGIVVDLRKRMISATDLNESYRRNRIYVISHYDSTPATSSLDMLEFINRYKLTGVALIVDHGKSRRDDHLQYLMHEDPGIDFLVHTAEKIELRDGSESIVVSDGFYIRTE